MVTFQIAVGILAVSCSHTSAAPAIRYLSSWKFGHEIVDTDERSAAQVFDIIFLLFFGLQVVNL